MIFGGHVPDYLQQTGIFLSLYDITLCIDIMIPETVIFKQLRHVMQGRTMQNKRAKYLNNSVICSVSLKSNLYLQTL